MARWAGSHRGGSVFVASLCVYHWIEEVSKGRGVLKVRRTGVRETNRSVCGGRGRPAES